MGEFFKRQVYGTGIVPVFDSVFQPHGIFQRFPFLLPGRGGLVYGIGETSGAFAAILVITQADDDAIDHTAVFVCDSFQ